MASGEIDGDEHPSGEIPKKMKALQYSAPEKFAVVEIDVPSIGDDDVLVKIAACGICSTDLHYHKGEFLAKYPLIPGHEATGTIALVGKNITHLSPGLRVTADPMQPCLSCTHCQRNKPLLCTALTAYGGTVPGGFAEYCAYPARQVHRIGTLPFLSAVLVEPAACAAHGVARMDLAPGARVLVFGSGPTGMLLAQMVRRNGAAWVCVAALSGVKLDCARGLGVADEYVDVDGDGVALEALKGRNPGGFDAVVEATGVAAVLEAGLGFVGKGGKLVVYGVYDEGVTVSWRPFEIWAKEITILASFCSMRHMPAVLEYVAGGLKLGGIVDRTFGVEEWGEAMEVVRGQGCVKAAVVFE